MKFSTVRRVFVQLTEANILNQEALYYCAAALVGCNASLGASTAARLGGMIFDSTKGNALFWLSVGVFAISAWTRVPASYRIVLFSQQWLRSSFVSPSPVL